MTTITVIDVEDLLLDADLEGTMRRLEKLGRHIEANVPRELLFTPSGSPNLYNKWGAIYTHVRTLHATLKAFT